MCYAFAEIVCIVDTKISLNENLNNLWDTEEQKRLIEQVGLIKSIIVLPNIVVCYAGNDIDKAAALLRKIKSVELSLERVIDSAFEIHKKAKVDDIEFIVGYCDENGKELISIKNGEMIRNCKVAWIGSWYAYNEFKHRETANEISNRHKGIAIEADENLQHNQKHLLFAKIYSVGKILNILSTIMTK